jgi:general stress protein 26
MGGNRSVLKWSARMLALTGLAFPVAAVAQPGPAAPDRAAVVKAAREVMAHARYCSLLTVGLEGRLQARIVDPFAPDESITVWIGTNPVTRKVAEIRKDPRATLICFDPGDKAYVTLIGVAEVVTDAAEKARHWKTDWAEFYKDGPRGEDYVLLRFSTQHIELASPAHELMNDPVTWRPVSVELASAMAATPARTPSGATTSAEQFIRGIYADVSATGGALPDWDLVRGYFLDEATIVLRTSRTETKVFTREGFIEDFVNFYERPMKVGDATRPPKATGFTERVVRAKTWEYSDIAHVIVLYEAQVAGWNRPAQQGVDSWNLVRRDGRWWVAAVTNEVVTAERPVPPELR